jgi:tRNA C32,U32 (ribose-2'-O)-methylase TrmJ
MDGLATLPTVRGEEGSVNLGMAVALFLYALSREHSPAAAAGAARLDRFADVLVSRLQAMGVFSSGDYRHGPARLLKIIKEANVPASEVPFLHALLTALDRNR